MPSDSTPWAMPPSFSDYYADGGHTEYDVRTMMQDTYQQNSSQWLQYMYEADIDTRMHAGDQEAFYTYMAQNYSYYKRNSIAFNKMRSTINMISGHQRRTRKSSIIIPQEAKDQQGADDASGILQWSMRGADAYSLISDAFHLACVTGMTLISTWIDYKKDPINGDLCSAVVPYSSFLIDPYFKKLDLSDCRYLWTRKWLSRQQAKLCLPGREKDIDSIPIDGVRDGKFPYMPQSVNYAQQNLMIYDEFWYMASRKQIQIINPETAEIIIWEGTEEEAGFFAKQFNLRLIKTTIPTVHYSITINDKVMYNGPNPFGIDRYCHVPFVTYFDHSVPYFPLRVQGVIRGMRDAQWSYNRRMRLQLDYLEAGISRGVKYVENALVDPQDAFLQGNGKGLPIKAGHTLDEVQEIPPPQIPPSWFQELERLDQDMLRIAGVNEELLGSADDDKAGILSMLRQGAGLTTLMPIFDKLDQSQKALAQLYWDLMIKNWEDKKFTRILGKQPDPEIFDKSFSKFDIQIIDGAMTPTQQVMEFRQLLEMQAAGIQIPPDLLIKSAPLQNKNELIKAVQAQQQQQGQLTQMQAQLQVAETQARIKDLESRAVANKGLGLERVSRVEENRALAIERVAEAKKDNEMADLNQIKAIKEASHLDLETLERAIQILRALEEKDQTEISEEASTAQSTQA